MTTLTICGTAFYSAGTNEIFAIKLFNFLMLDKLLPFTMEYDYHNDCAYYG